MKYAVTVQGHATVIDAGPDTDEAQLLEEHLDQVVDELMTLEEGDERLSDADLSASLAVGDVELSIVVEAANTDEANQIGAGTIRCAIHAAGGATPGWDNAQASTWALDVAETTQRKLDLADA